MLARKITNDMINHFNTAKETYEFNILRIQELHMEINDIQHILGLNNLDAVGLVKLAVALQKCLQERWQLKDENTLLEPLVKVLDQQQEFKSQLVQVKSEVDSIARKHGERKYTPRVRNDLVPELLKEDSLVKLQAVMSRKAG